MKYLKSFESIHFGSYKSDEANILEEVFGTNFYKIKEFLQKSLPGQNLKMLGAGTKGQTFKWVGNYTLPNEFYKKGFVGNTNYNTGLAIKITPYEAEMEAAEQILKKSAGSFLPGFVKIYWIKELELPKEFQWSQRLGAPEWGDFENYEDWLLRNPDMKGDKNSYRKWRTEGIKKEDIPKGENEKLAKVWLICQELLTLPTIREKYILEEISMISRKKIEPLIQSDEESQKILKSIFKSEVSEIDLPKSKVSYKEFEVLFWQFHRILLSAKKYGIPSHDFDASNFGYRDGELVAFDCA